MQKTLLFAACIGAFTLVPQAFAAQDTDASHPKTKEHPVQSPGQLSAEQVGKFLRQFDGNGDGQLDAQERQAIYSAFEKSQKNPEQVQQLLDKAGLKVDGNADSAKRKLSDKLSDKVLKHFDQDGDGKLGPEERAAAKQAKEHLDRNNDGQVDKHELEMGQKAFDRADRNNDGQLGPREKATAKQVKELIDRNNDSHVDKRELEAGKKAFDRADRNNDGQVGPREKADAKKEHHQSSESHDRKFSGDNQRKSTGSSPSDGTAARRTKPSGNKPASDSKSTLPGPGKNGGNAGKDHSGNSGGKSGQGSHNASFSGKRPGGTSGSGQRAGGASGSGGGKSGHR